MMRAGIQLRTAALLVVGALVFWAVAGAQELVPPRRPANRTIAGGMERVQPLRLSVAYDNYQALAGTETDWGFSCLVEGRAETILFDTGTHGSILLRNLDRLGTDLRSIDTVVLSHAHRDHIGGLASVLPWTGNVTVHFLSSFPETVATAVTAAGGVPLISDDPIQLCPGVHTTGALGWSIREQAMVVETSRGLVVITGCAHPGIVHIVRTAQEEYGGNVFLVLGGFHLLEAPESVILDVISDLRELGVERVAPTHCTGDHAIELFRQEYREGFVEAGTGRVILVD